MREMKDSGIEWIGQIPNSWTVRRGKTLFVNTKYIPGKLSSNYDRLSLTLKGVLPRKKDDSDGLQPKDFDTYQLLRKNELVFKLIDLQNVSTSRVGLAHATGLVSPAYIVLHANEEILPAFAEKFYLMMWYREIFNSLGDNGVRSSLNVSDLLNIPVCYPKMEEQIFLTNYLDTKCSEIDATAEDIQKEIDLLEEYKKSVITEAVTKGLNPDAEMKDSGIEYIGITPIHWNKYRLKYILLERNIRTTTGEEMLLSVSQYKGVVPSKDINNRTMQANSLIGYKIVKKDDLVFNKLNPGLARFGNSEFDGITSPDFSVYIVDDKKCTAKFLQHLLKTYKYVAKIKGDCTGVGDGFARLYSEQLYRFVVSLPPIEELHSIVAYIDSKSSEIDALIADKKRQLDILADYKKSLIYEYVTGKKEVPVNE
ncbi:restriction endonuclease subunit S [Phascolarctobacterium succinatutens]|uniref:restriction endonuclease subunit S n=1 Tax=Phascolarctobacterium succinatutens TaxID=626940 RepID=UPI00307ADB24